MRILVIFIFSTLFSYSQDKLDSLRLELNSTLETYSQINYFGIEKTPKDYGITLEEFKSNDSFYGDYNDTCETYEISDFLSFKIQGLLDSIFNQSDFFDKNYKDLAAYDLTIHESKDNKIFSFQLPIKSGGTMKFTRRWGFYKESDSSIVYLKDLNFSRATTFEHNYKSYYFLSRIDKGCSTCYIINYDLIHFVGSKFVVDFNYNLETRNIDAVNFDLNKKKLFVEYQADDLTGHCDDDQDSLCRFTYGFIGDQFGTIKK